MPARPRKPRQTDENLRAFDVVRIATHQQDEIADDVPAAPVKNPAAVALGKLGASKGGHARAAALTKKRKKEIAQQAAVTRWHKRPRD